MVVGLEQDPDEACYLYEYHSVLNSAVQAGYSSGAAAAATILAAIAVLVLGAAAT